MSSACASGNHHPPKMDLFSLPCTRSTSQTRPATLSFVCWSASKAKIAPREPTLAAADCATWQATACEDHRHTLVAQTAAAYDTRVRQFNAPPLLYTPLAIQDGPFPYALIAARRSVPLWRTESSDTCEHRNSPTRPQCGPSGGIKRCDPARIDALHS